MIVVGIKESGKKTHWYPGHPNDVSNDGAREFTIKAVRGWDAYRLAELFWLRVNSNIAPVNPVKFNWEKEFWYDASSV